VLVGLVVLQLQLAELLEATLFLVRLQQQLVADLVLDQKLPTAVRAALVVAVL
jgi:hypothetical protein